MAACNIQNEKQQITEPSISTRPTGSLNFASTENAQFPHSVFYDFPSPFEYQRRLPFYFSGSPLFILESLFHPRALTTGQLPQRRWRGNMERADWPWNIYGSLVLWLYEFWQRWHITVTLPQTKGLMCCYLLWLVGVRQSARFFTSSLRASLVFLSPLCV